MKISIKIKVLSVTLGMVLLSTVSLISRAETWVQGALSGDVVWNQAGSPYVISTNVLIRPDARLTIEPGTQVLLGEQSAIQVEGELRILGVSDNRVSFGAIESGKHWGGVFFQSGSIGYQLDGDDYSSGSILSYVDFIDGGNSTLSDRPVIAIEREAPYINNIAILNSMGGGILRGYIADTPLIVRSSKFNNIEGYAINKSAGSLILTDSEFITGGVAVGIGSTPPSSIIKNNYFSGYQLGIAGCSVDISANVFYENGTAFYLSCINNRIYGNLIINGTSPHFSSSDDDFTDNMIIGYVGSNSISIQGSHNLVADSRILSNSSMATIQGSGHSFVNNSGCGDPFFVIPGNHQILNSLFYNNSCGNEAATMAMIQLSSSGTRINNSNVERSGFSILMGTWAGQGQYVNATDNWWGTSEEAEIQNSIRDFYTSSGLAIIDFSPFQLEKISDTPISPPRNIQVNTLGDTIAVSWDHTTHPDPAGYFVYWGKKDAPFYQYRQDVGLATEYSIESIGPGNWYVGVTAYKASYAGAVDDPDVPVDTRMTRGHESWFSRAVARPLAFESEVTANLLTTYPQTKQITIENKGYSPLNIQGISLNFPNQLDAEILTDDCSETLVASFQSCVISVSLKALASGSLSGAIAVFTDGEDYETMEISILAEAEDVPRVSLSTTSLSYGTLILGETSNLVLGLENNGTAPLLIENLEFVSADYGFYPTGNCDVIAPGTTCDLQLAFNPVRTGNVSTELQISHNDPVTPKITIDLAGAAVLPVSLKLISADKLSGYVPLDVQFFADAVGGSGAYDFLWTLPSGDSFEGQSVSLSFLEVGEQEVMLKVQDASNPLNNVQGLISINPIAESQFNPVSISKMSADATYGAAPLNVNFQVDVLGGDGTVTYLWDFGNGSSSTQKNPSFDFIAPGTYLVSVSVTDSETGSTTSASMPVNVVAGPEPITLLSLASVSASQLSGLVPLTVDFSAQGQGGSGDYLYNWRINGEEHSAGGDWQHTFDDPGTYDVEVTLKDESSGLEAKATLYILSVIQPETLSVSFDLAVNSSTAPALATFSAMVEGGVAPYDFEWDFGDGTHLNEIVAGQSHQTQHEYLLPGMYDVLLVVRSSAGIGSTLNQQIFPVSFTIGQAPDPIENPIDEEPVDPAPEPENPAAPEQGSPSNPESSGGGSFSLIEILGLLIGILILNAVGSLERKRIQIESDKEV
ncbi:PKD domain-containing protein [Marinimicrobium alkaliphilum]|uniref:PKD domain-containing protein n=1 Tax=Marinimicrobium alkaliphilum TaxID=2202654 RepID=UPI0018E06E6E|nr:PKD domain-containing protein [Marinimicrobium alkaliphilum]